MPASHAAHLEGVHKSKRSSKKRTNVSARDLINPQTPSTVNVVSDFMTRQSHIVRCILCQVSAVKNNGLESYITQKPLIATESGPSHFTKSEK